MTDLPPLPPCPFRESGAHAIEAVVVDENSDLTYHCRRCGTVRRVNATIPLDDLTVEEIEARMFGRP